MPTNFYMGVDPGVSGMRGGIAIVVGPPPSVATLQHGVLAGGWAWRLPVRKTGVGKIEADLQALREKLENTVGPDDRRIVPKRIVVELQHPVPGQNLVASGTTMCNYGILLGALEMIYPGIQIETVRASKWQKAMFGKLPRGTDRKKLSIAYAQRQFEYVNLKPGRCEVLQHGMADALCIAAFACLTAGKEVK